MIKTKEFAENLIDFCYSSPTAFHAVESVKKILTKKKFVELQEGEKWKLQSGKGYFFSRNDSALIAFVIGNKNVEENGFRIVGAHTDSPCFRIKPAPEMVAEGKYLKLNTEVYGGPILSTWMDRPLAIAGRVMLKGKSALAPKVKLVNINKPICIIPNIAIHMNREANSGYAFNQQTDMLPFLGAINENLQAKGYLIKLLASELKIGVDEILDFDLFLYEHEKGAIIGAADGLISCSRIDDLEAVHAGILALSELKKPKQTCVMACFDNEEVGSTTRQGADSNILAGTIERIVEIQGGNKESFFRACANSFIVSADGAHALHPNLGTKCDPTNRPLINGGPVIKVSANRSYTSDAHSISIFEQICAKAGLKTQRFVNRSDMRGGSTIGPISSTHLDIPSVDVGIPILAMHSVRELCGIDDHKLMYQALQAFFTA